jgi:coenzyme F420-0:L-glutamate ligase / coenzyme F420-1:gamma-L-glutamate ligase
VSAPETAGSPLPAGTVTVMPVHGIGEVTAGADLGAVVLTALRRLGLDLVDGDVLVVSSKLVSKADGLRQHADREEVVDRESRRVVAERRTSTGTTRIVEAVAGPVMTAAGVDASNTGPDGGVLVLPSDPDLAARDLYAGLLAAAAPEPLPLFGVVLSDTAGRTWREGQVDFALGACGVAVLDDLRGGTDADGRPLSVTARAVADELAAAADLVKGKASGVPVALVRGLPPGTTAPPNLPGAATLVRSGPTDWFALGASEAVRTALGVPPGSRAALEVGLASVFPEELGERLGRVVRLACWRVDPAAATVVVETSHEGAPVLLVGGPDLLAVGRLAARLEIALHSERLAGPLTDAPGGGPTVAVAEGPAPPAG